jgi:hypothetical protein
VIVGRGVRTGETGGHPKLGSTVDGALCKEFIVQRARVAHDTRGHSGRVPAFRVKNAGIGKPASLRLYPLGARLSIQSNDVTGLESNST